MATREEVRLQEELNDALKISSSLSADIAKQAREMGVQRTASARQMAKELGDMQSMDDIQKQIEKNEQKISQLASITSGRRAQAAQKQKEFLEIANDSLKVEASRVALIEKVNNAANDLANDLSSAFDGLLGPLNDLPVIGGVLSSIGNIGSKAIGEKLTNAASQFTVTFANGLRAGSSAISSLGQASTAAASALGGALLGPLAILAGIVALVALGAKRIMDIENGAKAFREETGLLNSQTQQTFSNIRSVSKEMAGLGVSTEDVSKAAAEFTNTFGGLEQPAKSTLESMMVMNKNFGVSISDAAELNKLFQNMGGLTEAQAQSLSMSVVEMSKMAGVAPSKVIADLAKNSEVAYKYFRSSPQELAKAAVSLAAMGSSLESASKTAETLLDFENSIGSEMEANAMLGAAINLDRARAAAFAGDLYGQEKAIMEQMAQIGDISKMDVFAKEALSKATGKEISELENLQRIQQKFPNLDETRLAAAHALIDAGKDINKITDEDLAKQVERMAKDKEMQSRLDNLTNNLSQFGTQIMDSLMPVAEIVMGLLVGAIKPMLAIVSSIFSRISAALKPLTDMLGEGTGLYEVFEKIGSVVGFIASLFAGPLVYAINIVVGVLGGVFDIIGGIVKIFKGDFLEGIGQIGDGILGIIFRPIQAFFATIMDYAAGFFTIFSSLGAWITENIINPVTNFFGGIGNVFQSLGSMLGGGDEAEAKPTESVNDGVMQNGNVISTSPEDFLIATKNPAGLAEAAGGGSGMTSEAINTLIAEIKGLRADLASGKIGINMDGKKVTSGISKVVTNTSSNSYAIR